MNTTKHCSSPLHLAFVNRFGRSIIACALTAIGSSAMAATTWNFSTCNSTAANQSGAGTYGNSWSCAGAAGTNKVTASAWGGANSTGSTGFQTAYLSPQGSSGFGVASRYEGLTPSAPDHAADNSPTNPTPDLIVLKFDTAVALSAVNIGYVSNDADFTLMAYNGVGAPTVLGKNASNLNTGWALVENSAGSSTGSRSVNAGNLVSSWWLISAYSSSYGGGTLDSYMDYFKLLAVASRDVTQTSVPEPGSLALLGAGLIGMMASRRRSQKQLADCAKLATISKNR